ncbi:tetratricopeptide repeat protein [Azospirillum sp.]|uniref:tetratricopeptide repeat protein n=1 Tax=Azospirillum sp. TaxID=34012 RepID=UPI002D6790EE|nr:tetratricopeptide repeat protein [Azospirillum sp.]HYF86417.1 tetratricopeptide repeat protein [Azospirillum sp.]
MTTAELLDAALPLHRAGRLAEALALYRRILVGDPANADALHLSALIIHQAGLPAAALKRLRAALTVQPNFPVAWNSLGNILADMDRLNDALDAYARAVGQDDHYVEAYNNRGTVLRRLGRREEAVEDYVRALTHGPDNITARFSYGILQRELGRIPPAANAFYAVVQANPSYPDAWRHLAICLRGLGHPDAEDCLRRALVDAPADEELSVELGVMLNAQGRYGEARDVLAPAAEAHGGNALLHFTLGTALQGLGRLPEAVARLRHALGHEPTMQGACNNLGVALLDLGDPDAAAPVLRRAMALSPDDAMVVNNHGTALENRYDPDADPEPSARWYRRALRLRPDYGKALINLAGVHGAMRQADVAEDLYRRAVAAEPRNAEAYANMASRRLDGDDLAEAERLYRRALAINPGRPETLTGYGLALQMRGRIEEAEAAHRRALAIDASNADAAGNLGLLIWQYRQDADAAEPWMSLALSINPALGSAHLNRGLLRLAGGDFAGGWDDYRWRFRAKGYVSRRIAVPPWRGETPAGRRLLVWREQGVGDEILFASCFPALIARAGHVVIECDRRLVPLFARSFPTATVREQSVGETGRELIVPPDVDAHVAAGDLPGLLRDSLSSFGSQSSWLVSDPALVERWRERLAALGPGLRVGIGWRSQVMTTDRKTSYVMLEHWGPLFAVPGVVFVNLQYGDCEAELAAAEERFGVRIHRWGDLDLRNDFDGAAALTANLDLVISPAMSAGELAGGLGVPVWRFGHRDWTQFGTGVRPWFPAMRLFQPTPGEGLEAALGRIAKALRDCASPQDNAGPGGGGPSAGVEAGDGEAADPAPVPAPIPDSDPDHLLEQAVAAHRGGDAAGAAALYGRVLARRPRDPVALHLSGLLDHQLGASERGEPRIAAAVAAVPGYATAHISLGNVRLALGRAAQASSSFRAALALNPADAVALTNLGNALDGQGRSGAALRVQGWAVAADPELAEAHDNLGAMMARLGRWGEAEQAHVQALRRAPQLVAGWINLSVALRRLGRPDAADRAGRLALTLQPALADGLANRGRLLRELGEDAAAGLSCARALAVEPGHASAAFNGGVLHLAAGRLAQGWGGYDRRFDTRDLVTAARRPGVPAWGGEDLAGKRILVWREQGIGDELMFAQRLPELIARAGHVVVECDPRFVPLFARSFPQTTVRPRPASPDERAAEVDCHAAIGSLSRHLGGTLADFTGVEPVLRADPAAVREWRRRLAALGDGLRVGIAWRSGQLDPDRMPDYTRIEDWGPVLTLPGLVPITLQYGDCGTELAAAAKAFGQAPGLFPDLDLRNDLDGTAALMSALDLVIAPATSTGELAAALGVPVWRLARAGDWTALGTAVRPWFPSMRLFRTRPGQQVADLLPAVASELSRLKKPAG